MGRQSYQAVGYGMTESEARQNALEMDREENGHQDGYSGSMCSSTGDCDRSKCVTKPKIAKTCSVKKEVQKGARKWETVFVIQDWYGNRLGEVNTTQGDAIKKAKVLAIKHNKKVTIVIKKQLVSGSSVIAEVSPNKSAVGKWVFTGEAMC